MEANNSKKLREALGKFCAYGAVVLNTGMFNRVHLESLINMAKAALAAPVPVPPVQSNAAKLREALQKAAESVAEIMERVRHKDGLAFNTANYIAGVAMTALAAPPRNCDRFNSGDPVKDADDAYAEWQRWCDAADMPPSCKVESSFRQWLFATAKPNAKGATDGGK